MGNTAKSRPTPEIFPTTAGVGGSYYGGGGGFHFAARRMRRLLQGGYTFRVSCCMHELGVHVHASRYIGALRFFALLDGKKAFD